VLLTNEGKEKHYARVIARSSTQQLHQVCRSRWRLQAHTSQPEPVLTLFDYSKPRFIRIRFDRRFYPV